MSASPEFYRQSPQPAAAFPCSTPLLVRAAEEAPQEAAAWECRTPTSDASHLEALGTCPPAPRKPRPGASCKRRLFEVEVFSVRLEELERLFSWRQAERAPPCEKRRRV